MSECRHRRMDRQNLGGTSYPSVYYREICKECGKVRVAEYEIDAGGAIATCVAALPWREWKTTSSAVVGFNDSNPFEGS